MCFLDPPYARLPPVDGLVGDELPVPGGMKRRVVALLHRYPSSVGAGAHELRLRSIHVDDRVQSDRLADDSAPSRVERAHDVALRLRRWCRREHERILEVNSSEFDRGVYSHHFLPECRYWFAIPWRPNRQLIQLTPCSLFHLVVIFFERVQNSIEPRPVMSPTPKRDSFHPPKENGSRGTGTPTFTPIIPALARSITYRAVAPLSVKTLAALPYGEAFSIASALSRSFVRIITRTGPNTSS